MITRAALAFALACTAAAPAVAADPLSLLGTWSGPRERISRTAGYVKGIATLVITEQQGMTFTASILRNYPDAPDIKEPLWGAFTPGGNLIVGTDEERGVYSFALVDANTLDYCYVEGGADARAVCAQLTRQP